MTKSKTPSPPRPSGGPSKNARDRQPDFVLRHARGYARARLPFPTSNQVHDPAEAFSFIVRYKHEHDGNSPTTRDLMAHMHITSASLALSVFRALERAGLIRMDRQKSRAIYVVGGRWQWDDDAFRSVEG